MAPANFHENLGHREELKLGSNRKFGLVVGSVFTLIAASLLHYGHAVSGALVGACGLSLAAGGFLFPAKLTLPHRLWMKFGLALHCVLNPVIMLLLFVSTIVPVGLLMRLCGNDPMRRCFDPAAKSYWVERQGSIDSASLKRQF